MKTSTANTTRLGVCLPGYPEISQRSEWLVTFTSFWILTGLFLDGWVHNNIPDSIENFFTPWHAILYSGLAASMAVLGILYVDNLRKGYHWQRSLPPAYMGALLGGLIFLVAGNLDFIWHSLLGFEVDVEALVSPPHLLLASGGVLIISSPLRMAWGRPDSAYNTKMPWHALLSLFMVLGVFTFFTQFSNAFSHPDLLVGKTPAGDTYFWDVTIISSVIIPTSLWMGFILTAILRWKLPPGSLTLLIAGNTTLMFLMTLRHSQSHWPVLIAAAVGGILADILLAVLNPSRERVKALRWFSVLVPAQLFLFYFLALILTDGIWWRAHMWLGMIFFAGVLGLGLSGLAVPPYSLDTVKNLSIPKGEN